jgi:hypothetical protein
MKIYLVAVRLLVEAGDTSVVKIADALHGTFAKDMRKHAGRHSALVDWAIAGDDIASSIARRALADDYAPDETAFPPSPARGL